MPCATYTHVSKHHTQKGGTTDWLTDIQAGRQADGQADKQTGRYTDRDKQAEQQRAQADGRLSAVHTIFLAMHHANVRFRYVRKKTTPALTFSSLACATPPMFNVAENWGRGLWRVQNQHAFL